MNQRDRPKRLAEKLLAIRKRLGLSQSQMIRRLNIKGHYGRVSEFENGKRFPPIHALLAYARVAGVHIDDLVDDSVNLSF